MLPMLIKVHDLNHEENVKHRLKNFKNKFIFLS